MPHSSFRIPAYLAAALLWVSSGCLPAAESQENRVWQPITLLDSTLYGAWEMQGYGRLVELTPDTLIVYHRIKDYCAPDSGLVLPFSLYAWDPSKDLLSLLHQDYGGRSEALQTRVDLQRMDALPEPCQSPSSYADAAPSEVFDLLWTAFDEHYAFFDERGIEWNQQKRIFQPQVDSLQSVEELFPILSEMLGSLNDGHVNLYRKNDQAFNAGLAGLKLRNRIVERWREDGEPGASGAFVGAWHRQVHGSVYDLLDSASLKKGAADAIEWGRIPGDVAYIRINRFSGFTRGRLPRPAQLDTLHASLQEMITDIQEAKMAIVDVTLNGGGMDPAAISVAKYFADKPRHAVSKKIMGGHTTEVIIEPVPGAQFTKPVFLVTSEVTASAAEVFVLLMRAFPHVTHVGETTRGGISGMLPKKLPQDFTITISNEQVFDNEGVLYEGIGIAPQKRGSLFPDDSLYTGLAAYIRYLAELN